MAFETLETILIDYYEQKIFYTKSCHHDKQCIINVFIVIATCTQINDTSPFPPNQ